MSCVNVNVRDLSKALAQLGYLDRTFETYHPALGDALHDYWRAHVGWLSSLLTRVSPTTAPVEASRKSVV